MKHLIHLFIALAMFIIGTSVTTLFSTFNPTLAPESSATSRLAEEMDITGVVFRHQIRQDFMLDRNTYYLYGYNFSDPPEKVMIYLLKNGLPAKALSQLQYDSYIPYGGTRVFLGVKSIKWVSDAEVIVEGSLRCNDWRLYNTRMYIYRLMQEEEGWRVKSTETIN